VGVQKNIRDDSKILPSNMYDDYFLLSSLKIGMHQLWKSMNGLNLEKIVGIRLEFTTLH